MTRLHLGCGGVKDLRVHEALLSRIATKSLGAGGQLARAAGRGLRL